MKLPTLASLIACSGLTLVLTGAPATGASDAPPGFVSLFNTRDLTGWKLPDGDNGHWKVIDGVIDYDAESEAKDDKSLWTEREYGDFILHVEWRIKDTPFLYQSAPYILPDGTNARDSKGKQFKFSLPDADSGILVRGSGKYQLNIFTRPIGSGEMYGIRTDPKSSPELRAAATPRTQGDNPVGEWNRFEITVRGKTITALLNGKLVLPTFEIPHLPARGRIGLQHHGAKRDGKWTSPPSLVQFRNIFIKELKP